MKKNFGISLVIVVLTVVGANACSGKAPPKQELQATEKSIQIAIDSGAETQAPEDLNNAQLKLTRAQRLIKKKDYSDAKRMLHLANMDAKLALRTTQANIARSDANSALSEAARMSAEADRLKDEVSENEKRLLAQKAELEALKDLQAKQTDRGMVLTLGDVLFKTNEATLNQGAEVTIDRIAAFMIKYPDRTISIEGHTDNTGDEDYNYDLSLNRASAVMQALENRRVASNRITAFGKGEALPMADNNSESGRQQNRRVEIVFDEKATIVSDFDY